jgi:ABC-2 type transport system permease protein
VPADPIAETLGALWSPLLAVTTHHQGRDIYLSGLLFPLEGMPEPAQYFARILPITYFLRVIRGIVLKGIGLADLWPDVWPMVAFGAAIFTLAVLRFRKSLD